MPEEASAGNGPPKTSFHSPGIITLETHLHPVTVVARPLPYLPSGDLPSQTTVSLPGHTADEDRMQRRATLNEDQQSLVPNPENAKARHRASLDQRTPHSQETYAI
jgi:hypothetical protein